MSFSVDPLEGSLLSITSDMESFIADPRDYRYLATSTPKKDNHLLSNSANKDDTTFAVADGGIDQDNITSKPKATLSKITLNCPHDGCVYSSCDRSNLKRHISSKHEIHEYPCTHLNCTSKFRSKSSLACHPGLSQTSNSR